MRKQYALVINTKSQLSVFTASSKTEAVLKAVSAYEELRERVINDTFDDVGNVIRLLRNVNLDDLSVYPYPELGDTEIIVSAHEVGKLG